MSLRVGTSGWTPITHPYISAYQPSAFTVAVWLQFQDTPSSYGDIVTRDDNSFILQTTSGTRTLRGAFYEGAGSWGSVDATFQCNLYQTYHAAVTYDPSRGSDQLRLYIDGQLDNVATYTSSLYASTADLTIGARNSTRFINGYVEDVRVYNRQLSDNEILAIHGARGHDGIVYGLILRDLMNEGYSGQTASGSGIIKDCSISSNHGTPSNSPVFGSPVMSFRKKVLCRMG